MIQKFKNIFILMFISIIIFSSVNICNAAGASSKCFGDSAIISAGDSVDFALYGLELLGYSPRYSKYGDLHYTEILSWLQNTGNGYAFYIQTHGNSEYMIDSYANTLNPSEIAGGNWDLVFMDFSGSAATNNFATALNTVGYSNRGFLGWYGDIYTTEARLFNYYFWTQEVTTTPIQQAAIYAASSVAGDGTTPIRFYGDGSYYGYARD